MLEYFQDFGVSQSFLKNVLKNSFSKKDNLSMQKGSLVDHFVFIGTELNTYDGDINKYCEIAMLVDSPITNEKILAKVREEEYNSRYTDQTHLINIEKIRDFVTFFESNQGKIYTSKEVNTAKKQADFIKNSEHFQYLVGDENIYQLPLYGEAEGIRLKGLLDWVSINHTKKVINLIDLKTSHFNKPELFLIGAKDYRYDFQMAFYRYLLIQNYKHLIEAGYKIICYWLGYNYSKTFLWEVSEIDLTIGEIGCTKNLGDYQVRNEIIPSCYNIYGWRDALNIYKTALEKESSDYDLDYLLSKGFISKSIYAC